MMTDLNKFLEMLSATSDKFEWQISVCGQVRSWSQDGAHMFCPITAVYMDSEGGYFDVDSFLTAAKSLDIAPELAQSIVHAADGSCDSEFEYELRRRLIEALGFTAE